MSGIASHDHWFDRLAAPQTRRQMLKAVLAGAALTLPFARTGAARAADPSCFAGCDWTNHLRVQSQLNGCQRDVDSGLVGATALYLYGNPLYGAAGTVASIIRGSRCTDQALLEAKARAYDCLMPGCPGFDPHDKNWGPCKDCDNANGGQGFPCCPSTRSLAGYGCCLCCDDSGDGCKAHCP